MKKDNAVNNRCQMALAFCPMAKMGAFLQSKTAVAK